jgi:hypothetical protein
LYPAGATPDPHQVELDLTAEEAASIFLESAVTTGTSASYSDFSRHDDHP